MNHHIYIASALANANRVQRLRDVLARHDVTLTYDWTEHNGGVPYIPDDQPDLKREVAERELVGVYSAELVFIILPGGGGTHFEFGLAFALKKPIVMLDDQPSTYTPCFHYLNNVYQTRSEMEAIATVLAALRGILPIDTSSHTIDRLFRRESC